ncbi:MAG: hypothetical protein MZV70_43860 [Desulfobacterales bacterium]|nr:hypothetical protein [Desulfobacterales bacterium]
MASWMRLISTRRSAKSSSPARCAPARRARCTGSRRHRRAMTTPPRNPPLLEIDNLVVHFTTAAAGVVQGVRGVNLDVRARGDAGHRRRVGLRARA